MSGPENRSEQNDVEKNAEGLRKLSEALGQTKIQADFANQVSTTPAAQRAEKFNQENAWRIHNDSYMPINRDSRSPSTSSEQGVINTANHRDPSFRLNELRWKTNPNSMAAIENCISSVQDELQKSNPLLRDLVNAINKWISVPSDFPIQIPQNCKIPALRISCWKTITFAVLKSSVIPKVG